MPEEIMIIVVVSVIAGTAMIASIIKSIFGYAKSQNQKTKADSSLTTGELERLVRQAVEAATAPLHEKIDRLEARLDDVPLLEAPRHEARITLPDEDAEATLEATSRRPSREASR